MIELKYPRVKRALVPRLVYVTLFPESRLSHVPKWLTFLVTKPEPNATYRNPSLNYKVILAKMPNFPLGSRVKKELQQEGLL